MGTAWAWVWAFCTPEELGGLLDDSLDVSLGFIMANGIWEVGAAEVSGKESPCVIMEGLSLAQPLTTRVHPNTKNRKNSARLILFGTADCSFTLKSP